MIRKITAALLVTSISVLGISSISSVYSASPAQIQSAYTAQANFAKEFQLDIKTVSSPMFYDINNDKSDEIVITAASKDQGDWIIGYIGIYTKDGKKVTSKSVEGQNVVGIKKIKNKSYKNALAIVYGTGNGGVSVDVTVLQSGKLNKIYSTGALVREDAVIKDSDKDGSDEIYGLQYYDALETRSLSKADGIYDKMVYKWDVSKKKYIKVIYGQDGIEDTKRKKVDSITSKTALNLLQNARTRQVSMSVPTTLNNFNKKLEPLFTYNFIARVNAEGLFFDSEGRVTPQYLGSDDYTWLLPAFNSNKKATFKLSSNKQSATVTQSITENIEGDLYTVTYSATLVKTKYGWKVDDFRAIY